MIYLLCSFPFLRSFQLVMLLVEFGIVPSPSFQCSGGGFDIWFFSKLMIVGSAASSSGSLENFVRLVRFSGLVLVA